MSANEKNDLLYLLNILEHIGKIQRYTEQASSVEELYRLNDQMNLNASLTLLANIGENISKVTEGLRQEYSNIEWQQIKNVRNRIAHDYAGIDLAIVYEIIKNDLNALKSDIEEIIRNKTGQKIFDAAEVEISKDSKFYRHVDFEKITAAIF